VRAVTGQAVSPRKRISRRMLEPKIATTVIRRMKTGKARKRSVRRMRRLSMNPPA
jgi:hypothetical protein